VKAYEHFNDVEWAGAPVDAESCPTGGWPPCECEKESPQLCPECDQHPCLFATGHGEVCTEHSVYHSELDEANK